MRKKIIPIIMTTVCAAACAFGLAACGETNEVTSLRIAGADEQLGEELTLDITYGQKPVLDYKLYVTYQNGDKKELDLSDSKLTAVYFYSEGSEQLQALPDEYLSGTYSIQYNYKVGKSNYTTYVTINVAQATNGAFTVQPESTTWYVGANTPNVALKNPKGSTVERKTDDNTLQSDDTNGSYSLFIIKKDAYDVLTAAQKTDYDYINELYAAESEKSEKAIWLYLPDFIEDSPVGEYMLFATVDFTHNYKKIVTPAVKVTIKDVFAERTFRCQSIVVQDADGNVVTDADNQFVAMAESMDTYNQGKTLVCKANGEVRGTVDLGNGALDEVSAEEVYKYSNYYIYLTIMNNDDIPIGNGEVSNNTLTIKMPVDTNYYFVLAFNC